MKDAKISLRTDSDLKRQAEDYAKETGRTLAGLIDWLLRQELKKADSRQRAAGKQEGIPCVNFTMARKSQPTT